MNNTNKLLITTSKLDEITKDVVGDFIETGLDENYTVELKTYTNENAKNDKYKIRKAIASLANLQGGFILVGVKDKKNSKDQNSVAERIIGLDLKGEPQKWVDDICSQSVIFPRPSYNTTLLRMDSDKSILVIKVLCYTIGPIAIKNKTDNMLEFWSRGNGSDVVMDYIAIQNKYNSKEASIVKRAFMDLHDTATDILERQEHPIQINFYNTLKIVSSFVDDRIFYYEIIGYNEVIMLGVNNLRKSLTTYNSCIDIGNMSHIENKTINNVDDMIKTMKECLDIAEKEIIKIITELRQLFPEEGSAYFDYIKKLAKEHDKNTIT